MRPSEKNEYEPRDVDLRVYVQSLIARRWLILIVAALVVGAFLLYTFIANPPKYESEAVINMQSVAVPGLTLTDSTLKLAANGAALGSLISEKIRTLDPAPEGTYFVESAGGALVVRASAVTAGDAAVLISLWFQEFSDFIAEVVDEQVELQSTNAIQTKEARLAELTLAEKLLAEFDREESLSRKQAKLVVLESQLVERENRLRSLTTLIIPAEEARRKFLSAALEIEPELLGALGTTVSLPVENTEAGVVSADVTLLNPVFLQLSTDLMAARTNLAGYQQEMESLNADSEVFSQTTIALRSEVALLTVTRNHMNRALSETLGLYNFAATEANRVEEFRSRIGDQFAPLLVAPAIQREGGFIPEQRVGRLTSEFIKNLVLVLVLAAMLGVGVATVKTWYVATDPSAASRG